MHKSEQETHLENLLQQLQSYPGIHVSFSTSVQKQYLFEEWADHWMQTWRLGQVKDITYEATYREPIKNHLIPYFRGKYIHEITPSDIQEFFNEKATYCSMESQKKFKYCLRGIFETAVENKICESSPLTSSLRLWSDIPTVVKRAWTQEQYNTAFNFARHNSRGLAIMVLLETAISIASDSIPQE